MSPDSWAGGAFVILRGCIDSADMRVGRLFATEIRGGVGTKNWKRAGLGTLS